MRIRHLEVSSAMRTFTSVKLIQHPIGKMLTFSNGWVLGELRHPSSQCSSTATIQMYSGIEPLQRLVPRNAKQLNGIWAIEKFQLPYPSSMVWQLNSRPFWFGTRTIDLQRAHDIQSDVMSAPTLVRTPRAVHRGCHRDACVNADGHRSSAHPRRPIGRRGHAYDGAGAALV